MDFKQAETKFKQLKAQFDAGNLTENAFKAKLEEFMIRDERGDWWMIGYETERWYRNNGTDWVQADPPGSLAQAPVRTSTSNWTAMFLVTLGWAIGGRSAGGSTGGGTIISARLAEQPPEQSVGLLLGLSCTADKFVLIGKTSYGSPWAGCSGEPLAGLLARRLPRPAALRSVGLFLE